MCLTIQVSDLASQSEGVGIDLGADTIHRGMVGHFGRARGGKFGNLLGGFAILRRCRGRGGLVSRS